MKNAHASALAALATLALGLAPPSPRLAAGAPLPLDRGALDALVAETMAAHRLPSLSVAVARGGEIVYAAAAGLADLENEVPATAGSVYPIGSVTKPITAVAALRLAEAGELDLDAPLARSCAAFGEKAETITVRQLLAHTGGIRGYDYSRFEEDYLNRTVYGSLAEALAKFADDPLVAPPGTRHVYSSYGYVLVGCAIEGTALEPFGEHLRVGVLALAGTTRTRLDDPRAIIPSRVDGYALGADGEWSPAGCFNPSDRYPAGGLVATPSDLARFGIALLDGRLLSPPWRDAMWQPQATTDGAPTGGGLGWTLSEDGSEVFHGGTTVGGTAYLYLRPADGVVVALATNLSLWTEGRHEVARALADLATSSVADAPPAPPGS